MPEKEYKVAIVIGRFQPLHNQHLAILRQAFDIAEKVIVVLGSAHGAPTIKNPFSADLRKNMVDSLCRGSEEIIKRIRIIQLRDYFHDDKAWVADLTNQLGAYINLVAVADSTALLGQYKDGSSSYLRLFPKWNYVPPVHAATMLDATSIRQLYFTAPIVEAWDDYQIGTGVQSIDLTKISPLVPNPVYNMLESFAKTPQYMILRREYEMIEKYRKAWAQSPYSPVFVTADSVVTCGDHVLLIQRKSPPGQGLYAIPGGFLKKNELLLDGAIRELKEETSLAIPAEELKSHMVASKVFDYPDRDLRGRVITHAFHFHFNDLNLPAVMGDDDASKAFLLPKLDVMKLEDKFFNDHLHILNYFLSHQRL